MTAWALIERPYSSQNQRQRRNSICRRARHSFKHELLDSPVDRLPRSDLGYVQISFRVDRHVVKSPEFAGSGTGPSERPEDFQSLPLEDHDARLAPVADV